jgi:3-isopropylmalate/(R)-2-methylmalate dehydratase small subunit|tara:strand:+ start:2669 stop:3265 length:597 start_codon:yes stop_codon:yes gene_type:complete
MEKFKKLKSIPVYLPLINIDTDMIIPKQFLKTIKRTGLGKSLFYEMRYDENDKINNDFILNKDPYSKSKILIAGKNFGCGSSREHAPWALIDFGISCVISSSYADIFYNNCFNNGILPIIIDDNIVQELSEYSKRKEEIEINLEEQKIIYGNKEVTFELDPSKKKRLLEGLDDIGLSLKKVTNIETYESKIKNTKPWI